MIEPKPSRKKYETDIDPGIGSTTQHSSSDSDSESDLSDIQLQPRPTSQLLVRRLSQQRQHLLSVDYSQISDSEMDYDEEDGECDMDDLDVEYVEPRSSNQQRSREMLKKRKTGRRTSIDRVCKVGGDGAHSETVEVTGKRMEDCQRKNISVLFQPQSPLISENMKVRC